MTSDLATTTAALAASAKVSPACVLVIFGAGGDLTKRLLMPALYNLSRAHLLNEDFRVLAVGHRPGSDASFRQDQRAAIDRFISEKKGSANEGLDLTSWNWLESRLDYISGDFANPDLFSQISTLLGEKNAVFYLAVGDQFFRNIIDELNNSKLIRSPENAFRRIVIEKPFGHDLSSAIDLNAHILDVMKEDQVYRIDHFLGKETVQNIMAFRSQTASLSHSGIAIT
jgi:glucose-6-phosphate 1-dehydrogenase